MQGQTYCIFCFYPFAVISINLSPFYPKHLGPLALVPVPFKAVAIWFKTVFWDSCSLVFFPISENPKQLLLTNTLTVMVWEFLCPQCICCFLRFQKSWLPKSASQFLCFHMEFPLQRSHPNLGYVIAFPTQALSFAAPLRQAHKLAPAVYTQLRRLHNELRNQGF